MHLDPDYKPRMWAQLSYLDALVSFIPKRNHGAVHPVPGFLCCELLGLVLGSLSTSFALVLVAIS